MKASGAHVLESELPVGMADYAFVEMTDSLADPELTQRLKDLLGDLVREVTAPVEASMIELPLIEPERRRRSGRTRRATARGSSRRRARSSPSRGSRPSRWTTSRARACVGTGTLYRRFGDRAGLAFALLDEQTRDFQNALISGPPPLGPGAPARERLRAFGAGYLDLLERHSALMVAAAPRRQGGRGPVLALHDAPRDPAARGRAACSTPQFTAEALLATLAPAHHLRVRHGLGLVARPAARRLGRDGRRRSAAPRGLKPITMRASPETAHSV